MSAHEPHSVLFPSDVSLESSPLFTKTSLDAPSPPTTLAFMSSTDSDRGNGRPFSSACFNLFCVFTSFQPVNQKVVLFSHPDITAVPSTVSAMFASTQVCLSFARLVWVATPPILFSLSDEQTLLKKPDRPRANVCCELFVSPARNGSKRLTFCICGQAGGRSLDTNFAAAINSRLPVSKCRVLNKSECCLVLAVCF